MTSQNIHRPDCTGTNDGSLNLDPDCGRCSTMLVGDLDDPHFKRLMGCTRRDFETYAQVGANALRVQYRSEELERRHRRSPV